MDETVKAALAEEIPWGLTDIMRELGMSASAVANAAFRASVERAAKGPSRHRCQDRRGCRLSSCTALPWAPPAPRVHSGRPVRSGSGA